VRRHYQRRGAQSHAKRQARLDHIQNPAPLITLAPLSGLVVLTPTSTSRRSVGASHKSKKELIGPVQQRTVWVDGGLSASGSGTAAVGGKRTFPVRGQVTRCRSRVSAPKHRFIVRPTTVDEHCDMCDPVPR
jgi:hypothetical protein